MHELLTMTGMVMYAACYAHYGMLLFRVWRLLLQGLLNGDYDIYFREQNGNSEKHETISVF